MSEDVELIMKQIKVCTEGTIASLLGMKSKRDTRKLNITWYGCGVDGHIARAYPESFRMMKKKSKD